MKPDTVKDRLRIANAYMSKGKEVKVSRLSREPIVESSKPLSIELFS